MPDVTLCVIDGSSPLFAAILRLRADVFIHEQGISPEDEIDNLDTQAEHIAVLKGDEVIGTLRMLPEGTSLHIGRLAIRKDHRKQGLGTHLLRAAEQHAINNGFSKMILASQVPVVPFYERLGFSRYGDTFLDAGILHVWMEKSFNIAVNRQID